MKPKSVRTLNLMMTIVAISWVIGFIELVTAWIGIPSEWLLWIMCLSVLAHASQASWFLFRSGLPVGSTTPHLLAILVLGMPYIWRYDMRHANGLNDKKKTP